MNKAASGRRRWRFSFRVTVVGMFLIMTTVTAAVAIGLQYYFSSRFAAQSTLALYRQAASHIGDYLASVDARAKSAVRLLDAQSALLAGQVNPSTLKTLAATLRRNPLFYGAYVGFANGDLYELINLDSSVSVRHELMALPQDRWVLMTVGDHDGKRLRRYRYYDDGFHLRASRSEVTEFRANNRPWYVHAESDHVYKTEPYLFQHLQEPGQTYSMRLPGRDAVVAIDITLSSLSARLDRKKVDPGSQIYLYQPDGKLIASSENPPPPLKLPPARHLKLTPAQQRVVADNPVLTVSNETDWPPFDFMVSGQPSGYGVDMLSLISQMTGLKFHYVNGYKWPEFQQMFREGRLDILQSVLPTPENRDFGQLSKPFAQAPYGVLQLKGAAPIHRIGQLFGKRVAIPTGWSSIPILRREFPQVHIVEVKGVQGMFDAVRQGRVDAGLDTAAPLRYVAREFFYDDVQIDAPLDFGSVSVPAELCYSVRPARKGVVDLIDLALAHVTPAQRAALKARWLMRDEVAHRRRATVPYLPLIRLVGEPGFMNRLERLRLDGREHFVYVTNLAHKGGRGEYFAVVSPVDRVLAPARAEVKKALIITGAVLLLLLPLASWLASFIVKPVKQLAYENGKIRERRYPELHKVDSNIVEIDDLASSLMAMARSIEKHAKEQEALMDSFIKLIAQAIDEKSPYTGAHCARVPELALMLAKKAETSNEPPFDQFHFDGAQEWREFRIGAWLHDCGKITTPEYIVDKGTKLETINNRIHEIRTRFEVLWRDAEIRYLRQRIEAPETEPELRQAWERQRTRLQDDFAFIAASNVGSERMDAADVDRLEQLAKITWQRHFDDRLGLSHVELARRKGEPATLPATEPLLADKPWHIIERTQSQHYDPRFGIKMEVPEHLYNRGELYNLRIVAGTLTPEDRFKINEHIISTIRMLDSLPLPEELQRVPRYASTHHETLDGKGYPRKLTAKDLSIPERIMVLADIFEALTAADRPYKTAKPVSVAIEILHRMVQDHHVDRDVFELFLRSGTYLDYARRYLKDAQIDEVDVGRYLGR